MLIFVFINVSIPAHAGLNEATQQLKKNLHISPAINPAFMKVFNVVSVGAVTEMLIQL